MLLVLVAMMMKLRLKFVPHPSYFERAHNKRVCVYACVYLFMNGLKVQMFFVRKAHWNDTKKKQKRSFMVRL